MADEAAMRWAGVISRWIALAQVGVALPEGGEGGQWKRSIEAIVGLHALVAGLEEIADWPADQRAYAIDAAGVAVTRHRDQLARVWGGDLPESIGELLNEAEAAMAGARQNR